MTTLATTHSCLLLKVDFDQVTIFNRQVLSSS